MNRGIIYSVFVSLILSSCGTRSDIADSPTDAARWIEVDSAAAIEARIRKDFSLPYDEGVKQIREKYPDVTEAEIEKMIENKYIEVREIDGERYMFVRTLRNIGLLDPKYNGGWKHRGYDASAQRIAYVDSIIGYTQGKLADGAAHRARIRFSIDVPYLDAYDGDSIRVWMPYPNESQRMSGIVLIDASQPDYVISTPEQSAHRTIYMSKPVEKGDTTHFDYTVEFTMEGQYFSPEFIAANITDYDKNSEEYRRFTSFDGPHYVRLDSLAHRIVGDETDPYLCSEKVYDYIVNHYPWASAREYSTIPCIPEYVIAERHGDCGQVALLYISLMRTLGIPARWESGWMMHPGELNYHDWAEVYFEGVGWVPVDVSFGRYGTSDDKSVRNFYSTGIDSYRFATNTGIGDKLYPAKRYVRSETVDLQAGEVETSKGNLFFPLWDQNFEILSLQPISK